MKITLAAFGYDLLKILSVGLVAAQASEPVIDLTEPGIAKVYNLSVAEGLAVVGAFLGHSAAPPAPTPAAPAPPAPAVVDPATQQAPVPAVNSAMQEKAEAPVVHGPGLSAVVPA